MKTPLSKKIHLLQALLCASLGLIVVLGEQLYEKVHALPPHPLSDLSYQVCFTPNTSCLHLIENNIEKAHNTILVQAYSFTDPDVANALVRAKKRGVEVRILLDKSNQKDPHSHRNTMRQHNIAVVIDLCSGIAHNKVMIIDEKTVITGSYNFSKNAYTRNAENVLILHHPDMAKRYTENFQKRWEGASLWR